MCTQVNTFLSATPAFGISASELVRYQSTCTIAYHDDGDDHGVMDPERDKLIATSDVNISSASFLSLSEGGLFVFGLRGRRAGHVMCHGCGRVENSLKTHMHQGKREEQVT